jgi:hypothetical protein
VSLAVQSDIPSIYVGESSRSLFERSKEHWSDFRRRTTDSHILKHWNNYHGAEGSPKFKFKPVRFFRDALSRQVAEAIRIQMRGVTLNSKGSYNRCSIARLVLEERDNQQEDQGDLVADMLGEQAEKRLSFNREQRDKQKRVGRPGMKKAEKRREATVGQFGQVDGNSRKRRKFRMADEDWGEREPSTKELEQSDRIGDFLRSGAELRNSGSYRQTELRVWTENEA